MLVWSAPLFQINVICILWVPNKTHRILTICVWARDLHTSWHGNADDKNGWSRGNVAVALTASVSTALSSDCQQLPSFTWRLYCWLSSCSSKMSGNQLPLEAILTQSLIGFGECAATPLLLTGQLWATCPKLSPRIPGITGFQVPQ